MKQAITVFLALYVFAILQMSFFVHVFPSFQDKFFIRF